jgi:cytidine deaminase
VIRLALYGDNGAGKTTSAILLREIAENFGIRVKTLRMATPLYDLQTQVYSYARRPLVDSSVQDERLLSLLASELRRINPRSLHEYVVDSMDAIPPEWKDQNSLFLVEDSRPIDRRGLEELGFSFIHIWADSFTRGRRRFLRGDISLEAGDEVDMSTIGKDEVVKNTTDLSALRIELSGVLEKLMQS